MNDRPNILLIMADQLMPFLMGAYEHPVVKTPNLNNLAERGVRFDAAYTPCPLCAPARASLMTGKYISHNKVWDNASPLASDQPTVAHYLSNAGYDTVTSGKLHYVGPDQLHGFRRRLTTDIYPSSFAWLPTTKRKRDERFIDRRQHANGYRLPNVGVSKWTMFLGYDEETQFRAREYLHSKRSGRYEGNKEPFFLCVSFH
jgi:choline-sulfatase